MAAVVGSVGRAGSSALAGVVETGEILDAHVGVLAGSVQGSVDCAAKASWTVVAIARCWRVVLGVAVGASDHNVEVIAVLAVIDSGFLGDSGAPERALDVGKAGRIGAGGAGVDGRVTLEVDVEGSAEINRVAELLALDGIVGLESVEPHVAVGIY